MPTTTTIRTGFGPPSQVVELRQLTVGNVNTDGTGTIVSLKAAGANGSQIYGVDIFAPGTVTNGKIRFFLNDGTNTRNVGEVIVPATVPSATLQGFSTSWTPPNGLLNIPTGWTLYAAPTNSETFNLTVRSGDF